MKMITGDQLRPDVAAECLRRFVHRFTGEHRPVWAKSLRSSDQPYPVQFATDAEWLAHTLFAVKSDGTLDDRVHFCESSPTWPDGV